MKDDNVRFHAQRALMALEWIDRHAMARSSVHSAQLAKSIDDLRRALFKLIGTSDAIAADTHELPLQ